VYIYVTDVFAVCFVFSAGSILFSVTCSGSVDTMLFFYKLFSARMTVIFLYNINIYLLYLKLCTY